MGARSIELSQLLSITEGGSSVTEYKYISEGGKLLFLTTLHLLNTN